MSSVLATIVAVEKQKVLHNVSVCVCVSLVTHHAMCICHIETCPALHYFPTLSHKLHNF